MNSKTCLKLTAVLAVLFGCGGLLVAAAARKADAPKRKLPAAVEKAVLKAYPSASIEEFEPQRRVVQLIEVTITHDGEELDLTFSPDGKLLTIVTQLEPDDLPAAVRQAVRKVAGRSPIKEAEQIRIVADLQPQPLKKPRRQFEATFDKDGLEQDVIVSEDGQVVTLPSRLRLDPPAGTSGSKP